MRLINVRSFELEDLPDNGLPSYAIVSHTWDDDEVKFEDMPGPHQSEHIQKKQPSHKRGYMKIRYATEQAQQHGLSHVWIDTCCIDKKSSAELQEAINSMYRFYANASVCYVYLTDVLGGCPVLRDSTSETVRDEDIEEWKSFFVKSKWFRRGWTLQELIAPRDVRFYGHKWNFIGRKAELTKTIALTTGITPSILTHESKMSSISVAQRMSWAAHRETSRVEDQAYCLLGIFEYVFTIIEACETPTSTLTTVSLDFSVNMPMLYGEGSKAFIRLQEEIMKTSNDHSILAWEFDDGLEADGTILATSPSNFARCRDIVQWGRPEAFAMTNRGLQMNLRILESTVFESGSKREETLAILNCRCETDIWRILALRLQRYGGSRDYHAKRGGRCPPMYAEGHSGSRLTFVSAGAAERSGDPLALQITRHLEIEASQLRIWINLSNERFKIVKVFPEQLWTHDKRLMSAGDEKRTRGGVVVETFSGHCYNIAFGLDRRDRDDESLEHRKNVLFGIWGSPCYYFGREEKIEDVVMRSYEYCQHHLNSCWAKDGCMLMSESLRISDNSQKRHLDISAQSAQIMEDTVFLVTVAFNELVELLGDAKSCSDVIIDNTPASTVSAPPKLLEKFAYLHKDHVSPSDIKDVDLTNNKSVRAFQKQIVVGHFYHAPHASLRRLNQGVWVWIPPSLTVRYFHPSPFRYLPSLLFWPTPKGRLMRNDMVFSTEKGNELTIIFGAERDLLDPHLSAYYSEPKWRQEDSTQTETSAWSSQINEFPASNEINEFIPEDRVVLKVCMHVLEKYPLRTVLIDVQLEEVDKTTTPNSSRAEQRQEQTGDMHAEVKSSLYLRY